MSHFWKCPGGRLQSPCNVTGRSSASHGNGSSMEFPMTKRYVNGNTCIHNKQAIFYHNVSEGKAQVAHRILKTHFFPPNNWDGKIGNPYVGLEKNVVSLYTYFIFPLSCGHKYSHVFLVFFPGITGHRLPIPQISTDRYQIDVCSTF